MRKVDLKHCIEHCVYPEVVGVVIVRQIYFCKFVFFYIAHNICYWIEIIKFTDYEKVFQVFVDAGAADDCSSDSDLDVFGGGTQWVVSGGG